MNYYKVASRLRNIPADYHAYGYETSYQFEDALQRIINRWGGRTGKSTNIRHGCIQLVFVNKFDASEYAWIPSFMLDLVPDPLTERHPQQDTEEELDKIYGFD